MNRILNGRGIRNLSARTPRSRSALAMGACALLTACASGQPAPAGMSPAPGAGEGGWTRDVYGIPVLDAQGQPYEHPWLGGLIVPRPQFIDVDGDRDLDLFVQERSNEIMHFENVGTSTAPRFVWRTDKYRNLDVGEWYRFVDMDGDGDPDLIGEQPYSYIRLYRNTGTPTSPQFVAAMDTLYDSQGNAIFADRQNIANAADIDCDGLMDLFLGRVDGTVARYEEEAGGAARFRLLSNRFEDIEIVAQMAGGSRHGANAMFFADHDGDGDLDLYWGDYFEAGILLIRNNGSCGSPNLRTTPVPLVAADGDTIRTSGYNVPVLRDLDGDGDNDLFIGVVGGAYNPNRTQTENFIQYERTDAGYELRTRRFLRMIDVGSESLPAFGDVDGDGDLDMLVGNKVDPATLQTARLYLFRNIGSAREPRFQLADTLDLAGGYHHAPHLADVNGDGLTDLLLGTWNEGVLTFINRGTPQEPRWVQDTTLTVQLTRGSNTTPAAVDIDGDGDLDLFSGEASGTLNFFRNTGTRTAPRWELVSDEWQGIDPGRRSHPVFRDLDGDGDYDMIMGREDAGAEVYRNVGTATEPRFERDDSVLIPLPALSAPAVADLDGDGTIELVSGNLSGGLFLLRPPAR